ncbi:cupin domain-containing protein [Streptomyces beihaiensis]|uniref:Cupin domain-containing protein n=1 Tax=Streptomyces beihaiensis TaxID=2984495 RepID=A0ABT3U3G5_9ACTN|nr:cupin domain-containing protein [Streptomyces beihaiensis]MCX3063872.1 cupin domain-containing protein [Streptomyces beihaiensis]
MNPLSRPGSGPAPRSVSLSQALRSFDALWSPRILTTVNDYDVRVAKAEGEHVWHVHEDTDEFFLVVEGRLTIALREDDGEREVVLDKGSVFTVPRGTWHKPSAAPGTAILLLEPTGTATTGDAHDPVPDHVDSTTGHAWHS